MQRLALWSGSGPLNARDQVVDTITTHIDDFLKEAAEDPSFLNLVMAYLRCLVGVLREAGGGHLVIRDVPGWQQRVLTAFEAAQYGADEAGERQADREFILVTFHELHTLAAAQSSSIA